MTKEEFITKVVAGNGVMEEVIGLNPKKLELYIELDGIGASVDIREFEELGISDIEEDYFNEDSDFNGYEISCYLDEHPEHELWDDLYEDWLSNKEEK